MVVGVTILIANFVLKFVPERFFPQLGDETPEEVEISRIDYATLRGLAKENKNL